MATYYLAVDIGASSGRHILGTMANGKLALEEVYRFENGMIRNQEGHLCWDIEHLLSEIKEGLKICKAINKIPTTMGIDTWAVDYVLLDEQDKPMKPVYGYRDSRTKGMDEKVYQIISPEALYAKTGIQKQPFNTIFQLMAEPAERLQQAKAMLMIPDYLHFCLTGKQAQEYTNATTTQLVDAQTKQWDKELIQALNLPTHLFQPLQQPGTEVGHFSKEIQEEVGFDCTVILPATHDTGSAVLAVPAKEENFLYISSGTWSLMGTEQWEPDCREVCRQANLTNEGGIDGRFRFLKNIMGLWMIQSVRHELNDTYSFAQLCQFAEEADAFPSRVDVNDESFLAPDSMIEAVKAYCKNTNQPIPQTVGELAAVIYQSLAESYAQTVKGIEDLTGINYPAIYVVGGGCNADYLNRLTAKATGKNVLAGPAEATATGNLLAQLLQQGIFSNVNTARQCVRDSFEVREVTTI